VAILLVVLHHAIDLEIAWLSKAGIALQSDWQLFTLVFFHRLGKVAVPLFLFVSGSFIAYAARGNPPKLSWQSVQSALRRLLLPYLVWSLLFYALIYFQRGERYDLVGYAKNLLVGYPFHFVPLLIFYYAISVPLARIAKSYGLLLIAALAVGQLWFIGVEYPGTLGFDLPGWAQQLSVPVLGGTLALWAIYFPLGMVYSLNSKSIQPWLERARWPLLAFTLIFFGLDVLHTANTLHMPLAVHLYPLSFVLLMMLVKRQEIPKVEAFEYLGKRSYGLYLTHLIVIDVVIWVLQGALPSLLTYPLLVVLPIFALALTSPLLMMAAVAATPTRNVHRYVFG
jgi:fucose 4-O-acetylase-like acetyltransferase